MPRDPSHKLKGEEPRETGRTASVADGAKSDARIGEKSRLLHRAQQLLDARQESAAIELLENYLAENREDEEALELLEEAYRSDEGVYLEDQGSQYYYVQTPTSLVLPGEGGLLEGWDVVKDEEAHGVDSSQEEALRRASPDSAEEISAQEDQHKGEEAPPPESSSLYAEEYLVRCVQLNSWLGYAQVQEGTTRVSPTLSLIFFNGNDDDITIRLTSVSYPLELWPPGRTTFPWYNVPRRQRVKFQDIEVTPGKFSYDVKVVTIEGSTTKVLSTTLEIKVSDDKPPKIVDIECR